MVTYAVADGYTSLMGAGQHDVLGEGPQAGLMGQPGLCELRLP